MSDLRSPDQRSPDYDERRDESRRQPPLDPEGRITPVLEPNEARAGTTKPRMWRVLAAGLVGAVVVMLIAWFLFFPTPDATQTALPPADPPAETPGFEPAPTEPTVP